MQQTTSGKGVVMLFVQRPAFGLVMSLAQPALDPKIAIQSKLTNEQKARMIVLGWEPECECAWKVWEMVGSVICVPIAAAHKGANACFSHRKRIAKISDWSKSATRLAGDCNITIQNLTWILTTWLRTRNENPRQYTYTCKVICETHLPKRDCREVSMSCVMRRWKTHMPHAWIGRGQIWYREMKKKTNN